MSMTFTAVREQTDEHGTYVATIDGSPELNVANANGAAILRSLGEPADYCGSMAAVDVLLGCAIGPVAGEREDVDIVRINDDGVGSMGTDFGRTTDQCARYAVALSDIAAFAEKHGGRVGWC